MSSKSGEVKDNPIFYSDCRHLQLTTKKIPTSNGTAAAEVKATEPQTAANEESLCL